MYARRSETPNLVVAPLHAAAREDGQAPVEWGALLLIVAAVLAAMLALGLPDAVAASFRGAVCSVLRADCQRGAGWPQAQPRRPSGVDPSAPTSGPPIGGGLPVPVLPFNGMTVSGSISGSSEYPQPKGESGGGEPGAQGGGAEGGNAAEPSFKITSTITGSVARGNPVLNSNCQETVPLSVSVDLQTSVEAGVDKEGTAASGKVTTGATAQYELDVTPQQAGEIAHGATGAPNPLDPRSIPTGDGIVLNETSYKQLDLTGAYRGLTADLGYQQGRQVSSGIQALGNGQLRIYVGDSRLVQNALTLGIGNADIGASIGASDTMTDGKLRQVDIDVTTPTGWATYQQFLHTGVLPTAGKPGVSAPATQQVFTDTGQFKAEAHLFGLSGSLSSNPSALSVTETDNADGTKSNTLNYRYGNVTEVITTSRDAAGADTGDSYELLLHNASPSSLANYSQMTGQRPAHYGSNQDVVVTFTTAQLEDIQQMAFEQLAAASRLPGATPMSAAQVRRYLSQHPDAELPGMNYSPGISLFALAHAKSPAQILQAIQNAGDGSADTLLYQLGVFGVSTAESQHPGQHNMLPYLHPLAGQRVCGRAS